MPHPIDYTVYQHLYNQSDEFMKHLKEVNDQTLVKPYCLRFDYAAQIIEELIQTKKVSLEKEGELYCCRIDGKHIGTSRYPSMAVCLAVLDLYGEKERYEEEAKELVEKQIEDVKKRSAELERRLKQDRWEETN